MSLTGNKFANTYIYSHCCCPSIFIFCRNRRNILQFRGTVCICRWHDRWRMVDTL